MVWLGPTDSRLDPHLIDCGCRVCQRGTRCSRMRAAFTLYERQQLLDALTDADRVWLTAYGWDGR